jgi:hypothetical protein
VKRLRLNSLDFYSEKFGAITLYLPGQEVGRQKKGAGCFRQKVACPLFFTVQRIVEGH